MGPAQALYSEFDHVILGGGNVAGYSAREFVKINGGPLDDGYLCIISEEPVHPYERPALSKGVIMGKAKLPGYHTCAAEGSCHKPDWYVENNITVLLNSRCTRIDWESKIMSFGNNPMQIKYKKLLLAT